MEWAKCGRCKSGWCHTVSVVLVCDDTHDEGAGITAGPSKGCQLMYVRTETTLTSRNVTDQRWLRAGIM